MIIKAEVLKALAHVAEPHDPARPALACIQVDAPRGRAVATDGHVLLIATEARPIAPEDFPTAGMPEVTELTAPALLPATVAARLLAAMPKKSSIASLRSARVGTTADGAVVASATDLTAPCTITLAEVAGQFPNVDRVMPEEAIATDLILCLGVPVLETLIKSAKAIGATTITLSLPTVAPLTEKGIVVSAFRVYMAHDGITLTGAAMPCRT